jgi:hypothetical protein
VSPNFFSGYVAWHWKRWSLLLETGHLREEFERQVLDEELVASLFKAGVIRTAAAIFDERRM